MNGRILSTVFVASTGLALVSAAPAQAACPERVELLKQFVETGAFDQATKAEIDQLSLEGLESEEACERTVAELERRLNVEVREDEVVRMTAEGGETPSSGSSGQASAGGQQATTGGSGQQQADTGDQTVRASGQAQTEATIGGGLDIPRDQIDTKYGPLAWMTFDEVIGAEVISPDGDPIGEIIGLVRDRSSEEFFAVLDAGAGDEVLVNINHFEIAEDDRIGISGDSDDLENMPRYDAERYEDVRG